MEKPYQQISDRIFVEFKKTFRFKKNPPRFSLIMRMVKKVGEEETIKILGNLRERKLEPKDWNTYLIGIFKKETTEDDEKELVIARLKTLPPDKRLSIG